MSALATNLNAPLAPGGVAGLPASAPVLIPIAPQNAQKMRSLRIALLILVVLVLSIADLYMTLTYLQGPGMGEGNPIARWVMSANCGWALSAFKMGLVGLTCIILWVARRRASGEIAAWACALILVWLTFQWKAYSEAMPALSGVIQNMAAADHPDWVKFETD